MSINSKNLDIAIIGMDGYFPGANNLETYWSNLCKGVSSVRFFSDEELISKGVSTATLKDPNYVKASPILENINCFDAEFFNISPGEAKIMDPQRRLFLENCWHALEDAGYIPGKCDEKIGIYGSAGINLYLLHNLYSNKDLIDTIGELQLLTSNDKDGLPTQVSYQFNLTGPSINVNTACSSSLVAIHLAMQSILLGEVDLALAGGSALIVPNEHGYFYQKDSILSPDGYCRAFDEKANGTLWGSGSGVVLLKRLTDAIADKDNIRAVIKGSSINNDGSLKVGYTAPSIEGQSEAIYQAYASSGINPETVSYIEAHGTGTKLGDPVEIAALKNVFDEFTKKKNFCAVGSVKTNIGHLGAAAGIASIIKTVLALENKQIPPSLNFTQPNKKIDFANSHFYINNKLTDWAVSGHPRRAGVSSLGVGGTNAHIILEEAPGRNNNQNGHYQTKHPIVLSAKSVERLEETKKNLVFYLEENPGTNLSDLANTLQIGRKDMNIKQAFKVESVGELLTCLKQNNEKETLSGDNFEKQLAVDNELSDKLIYAWFKGDNPDWKSLYNGNQPGRLSIPGYPFKREKHWIEPSKQNTSAKSGSNASLEEVNLAKKAENLKDWFYTESWKQVTLQPDTNKQSTYEPRKRLIFLDKKGKGKKIGEKLQQLGDTIIYVTPSKKFIQHSDHLFEIDIKAPDSYVQLIQQTTAQGFVPDSIIHCWGLDTPNFSIKAHYAKKYLSDQYTGSYSLLYLIKALTKLNISKEIKLFTILNDVFDITGEEKIYHQKSPILSATKVIQQEYPNIIGRSIDVSSKLPFPTDRLVDEIRSESHELICAYRNNNRWLLEYEQVEIPKNNNQESILKKDCVILVYGGLLGIGPTLYEYIVKTYNAKILILDDQFLPKPKEWDNWVKEKGVNNYQSLKIEAIRKIQSIGGEYIGTLTHLYDRMKLNRMILKAEKKFGKINGIIHASGCSATGRIAPIPLVENQLCEFNIYTIGVSFSVFHELLKHRELDFRMIWTSLSNVLGGPTFFGYSSGNSIALSYARQANKKMNESQGWRVYCWDSWETEWEGNLEENMSSLYKSLKGRIDASSVANTEGFECFERLSKPNIPFNPMIISGTDLKKRYEIWVKLSLIRKGLNKKDDSESSETVSGSISDDIVDIENTIMHLMKKLLAVSEMDVNDNFYDLGGHSLLAVQFAAKIRETFKVDVGLDSIFEHPTAYKMARQIKE
jgi:3-oxoacyl-(acyl-carrier-protein) synthase/acyl carrier protein